MKKIEIGYKRDDSGWQHLATRCPNGINCFVGSAYCFECKYCDKKNSVDYKYVMCKLENRQLDLFEQ